MGFSKHMKRALATVAAAATLLSGGVLASTANADGGGGWAPGGGGSIGTGVIGWAYNDNNNGGFGGASLDAFKSAVNAMGATFNDYNGGASAKANQAITMANNECVSRFNAGHPGENANCRMVAVGVVTTPSHSYTGDGFASEMYWKAAWDTNVANGAYHNNGQQYRTSDGFSDASNRSVDSIAATQWQDPNNPVVIVIMLNQYEPVNPSYDLGVTTSQQAGAGIKVGSTSAVSDVIHASANGSTIKENLNAKIILHYDGQPDGYVKATSKTKTVSIANNGDTTSPGFTPADLNMTHWQEGKYWFDVQVDKQGLMGKAVDTADREASESFEVKAVPPTPPAKTIDKGTSASAMVNHTAISSGTGAGGYRMTFKDVITPNGVDYTVDHFTLTDTTTGADVSGEFEIGWDKAANIVSAVRAASKGELPVDHMYVFGFDVTVSKPDFSKVQDTGEVTWNHEPEVSTDSHEFPTWKPNPDKSWIRQVDGKWRAVIDPKETNETGADKQVLLDGDPVASVVNGTIAADLVNVPQTVTLSDDWSKADYLFDAAGRDAIRVYEADASTDRESSVADIVNTGHDVTDKFDVTVTGTKATASAHEDYRQSLKGLKSAKQLTLLIPGTVSYANGKGAAQVRRDFKKDASDELTFCENPDGSKLTNKGSQTVNDDTQPTNEPYICGYVPPVKKQVIAEGSEGGDQADTNETTLFPGQKIEYRLTTRPQLPDDLAYQVTRVAVTDTYDPYLTPDKQTVEVVNLGDDEPIGICRMEGPAVAYGRGM
jgi:hypothetical protein